MAWYREGDLVLSTNRGRYAIDLEEYPHDLTSGDTIEIDVAGRWIYGYVEHAPCYSIEALPFDLVKGYYLVTSEGGNRVGLCVGMHVRMQRT